MLTIYCYCILDGDLQKIFKQLVSLNSLANYNFIIYIKYNIIPHFRVCTRVTEYYINEYNKLI